MKYFSLLNNFVIELLFSSLFLSCGRVQPCEYYESESKESSYNLNVLEKFRNGRYYSLKGRDINGNQIVLSNSDGQYIAIIDSLEIGDKIVKELGVSYVKIYKKNRIITLFLLECDEKKEKLVQKPPIVQ